MLTTRVDHTLAARPVTQQQQFLRLPYVLSALNVMHHLHLTEIGFTIHIVSFS